MHYIWYLSNVFIIAAKNGIECPMPVKNNSGNYFSIEKLVTGNHVVRLLTFLPGKILLSISHSPRLYYQCGEFAGKVDQILKVFI